MNVDGISFHFENVKNSLPLGRIQAQSSTRLAKISPSRSLRISVIQSGREFEGVAWGTVSSQPVNAYCRSNSIHKVIQSLESQIKSQFRRRRKQLHTRASQPLTPYHSWAISS